jgi:hypothetical protein
MYVPTRVVRAAHSVLPVTASGLVLLLAAAALPDLVGLALVAAVSTMALLLQCGVSESLACRLLAGGRSPTVGEAAFLAGATTLACRAGLGPPVVQLRVQPRNGGVVPYAWGTATVVVPRGLVLSLRDGRVSPAEAAAGLCHAGATCRAGLSTSTAALTLWCLPWTIAAGFLTGLRRGLKASSLPLLAWRCRLVVSSIAVVQPYNDRHLPMAAVVAGIAAATYAQPALSRWCSTRVAATGDREVVGLGLGTHYARLLTAAGYVIGLERHVALTATPDAALRRRLAPAGLSRR